MGLFGPPNIDKMKSEGNVGGLIKALGYKKDPGITEVASSALVELIPASIEPLIQALNDKEEQISQNAVETLTKIGMPAIGALIAGLEKFPTRDKCTKILKQVGDPAVKQVVDQAAAWVRGGGGKREDAIQILADLGPLAEGQLLSLLGDPCTKDPITAYEPMVLAKRNLMEMILYHNDLMKKAFDSFQQGATLHRMVISALGKAGGSEAVDSLIAALDGEYKFTRWVIFGSLYKIGSRHAMIFLNEHLEDDDLLISGTGQVWLLLGDGVTIKRLLNVLLSNQEQASHSAAETLKELGSRLDGFQ